jgi:hypothetical protein
MEQPEAERKANGHIFVICVLMYVSHTYIGRFEEIMEQLEAEREANRKRMAKADSDLALLQSKYDAKCDEVEALMASISCMCSYVRMRGCTDSL